MFCITNRSEETVFWNIIIWKEYEILEKFAITYKKKPIQMVMIEIDSNIYWRWKTKAQFRTDMFSDNKPVLEQKEEKKSNCDLPR